MGFLDKLLGRGKDAAETVGDTAKDMGDKAMDVVQGDVAPPAAERADEELHEARDQALRDEGQTP